jgi:hypothetical protein
MRYRILEEMKKAKVDLDKGTITFEDPMDTYRIVLKDGSEYFCETDRNAVLDFYVNYDGEEFALINKELLIRVSELVSIEKIK